MKCSECKNLGHRIDDDGVAYDWCEKVIDCTDRHMERNCKHFERATNADRIRAMTDEELAKMFWNTTDCELCQRRKNHCSDDCSGTWLDWLKSPVKDGDGNG